MVLFWVGLGVMCSVPLTVSLMLLVRSFELRAKYLPHVERIFQEKPLFVIPRGQPVDGAEEVSFPTADGLTLRGCYLRTAAADPQR